MIKLGSLLYKQKSLLVVNTSFRLQSTINNNFRRFVRLQGPAQGKRTESQGICRKHLEKNVL